jgi:hypothetical protein
MGPHVIENRVSQIFSKHEPSLPPTHRRRNGKGGKLNGCAEE